MSSTQKQFGSDSVCHSRNTDSIFRQNYKGGVHIMFDLIRFDVCVPITKPMGVMVSRHI